jgi:hypothetical protein
MGSYPIFEETLMGQAKHNPNVQLAKEGKLPPKPKKLSKRETERLFYRMVEGYILEKTGIGPILKGDKPYER